MDSIEGIGTREATTSQKVSIRCARHKKRMEVTREWVERCSWLCPKCYEKLTEEERMRYAPARAKRREGVVLDAPKVPKPPSRRGKGETHKRKSKRDNTIRISDASLLPRYVMLCRECKEWRPVHKVWFDMNPYVCPSCASRMTPNKIKNLARRCEASGNKPEIAENKSDIGWEKSPFALSMTNLAKDFDPKGFDGYVEELSSNQIGRLSIADLKKAVQAGRLSKVRANIEIRRRRNKDYYDNLPEVEESSIRYR